MNKKLIASAIVGLGLAASGSASAITVGGVDFGAAGLVSHLETTTLAETFISGNNQQLFGYGQVNTVNGNLSYAGANRLYFVFDQYISNSYTPTAVNFTLGEVRVYLMPTFNLLAAGSVTNMALIQSGSLWATFQGHGLNGTTNTLNSSGIFTGNTISFTGAGLLDVVAGGLSSVQAYLDSNGIGDGVGGLGDIALTTSGNNAVLNPFDVALGATAGCANGTAVAGAWCIAGSADLRGLTTVPEPGVLALFGLGLLGMGVSLRNKHKAV